LLTIARLSQTGTAHWPRRPQPTQP
jgi:hypothetical protein